MVLFVFRILGEKPLGGQDSKPDPRAARERVEHALKAGIGTPGEAGGLARELMRVRRQLGARHPEWSDLRDGFLRQVRALGCEGLAEQQTREAMKRASGERALSKEELWELMQRDAEASALSELGFPVPEGLVLPCAVAVQERLGRIPRPPPVEYGARLVSSGRQQGRNRPNDREGR